MKKVLSFLVAAAFLAANVNAQEANIFAFGLKASAVSANYEVDFSYTLNANAKSVKIEVSNGDSFVLTEAADLTKGSHKVTKRLVTLVNGEYTWSVTAEGVSASPATPTKVTTGEEEILKFSPSRSMVVDSYFDSPGFGRIYVSTIGGATNGERTLTRGIYVLDAALTDVTGQGDIAYNGGVTWKTATLPSGPMKLWVGPDGTLYIGDWLAAATNCLAMDPTDPGAPFKKVLGGGTFSTDGYQESNSFGQFVHGTNSMSGWVLGTGEDALLYIMDNDYPDAIYQQVLMMYPIGSAALPYDQPPIVVYDCGMDMLWTWGTIAPDGQGGWWICQNRNSGLDVVAGTDNGPSLIHLNASGVRDFSTGDTEFLGSSFGGAVAVTNDFTRLAVGGTRDSYEETKQVSIYEVNLAANPPLKNPVHIATNSPHSPGVQFDNAGNLYVLNGASNQPMLLNVYALPKDKNIFTTPAPASQTIIIQGTGINAPAIDVKVFFEGGKIRVIGGELEKVFDIQGRIVGSAPEAKGVYLVQVKTYNGTIVKRLIK